MRDVIFYPYHTFIDDIFEAHKRTLPPYQLAGVSFGTINLRKYAQLTFLINRETGLWFGKGLRFSMSKCKLMVCHSTIYKLSGARDNTIWPEDWISTDLLSRYLIALTQN